ncbi:MAG: hypothetical protein IPG70_10685 [Moraxellaceae bacterium]|nr:hypothetical protein [Moraxellaceae bacterium]
MALRDWLKQQQISSISRISISDSPIIKNNTVDYSKQLAGLVLAKPLRKYRSK